MATIGGLGTRPARAPGAASDHGAGARPESHAHMGAGPNGLRHAAATVVLGIALLAGVFMALGFAIRGPLAGIRHFDTTVSRWFLEQRSGTGNLLTHAATWLAETPTVVVLGLVVTIGLLIRRRTRDATFVVSGLLVEFVTYIVVVLAVDRPRPAHGLEHRFTGSYPSGHVAAAITLYGLLAILAARRIRSSRARVLVFCVPVLVAVAVGASRLYREMHHFSDVVAGALIGVGALTVATRAARRVHDRDPVGTDAGADTEEMVP
jgi:membrane-associated phospholipid phosphatase